MCKKLQMCNAYKKIMNGKDFREVSSRGVLLGTAIAAMFVGSSMAGEMTTFRSAERNAEVPDDFLADGSEDHAQQEGYCIDCIAVDTAYAGDFEVIVTDVIEELVASDLRPIYVDFKTIKQVKRKEESR